MSVLERRSMRKTIAALAIAAAPVLIGAGFTPASMAALSPSTPVINPRPGINPVHSINLHNAFMRELPHERAGKIGGVVYPRGRQPSAAKTTSTCTEPDFPLIWNGGPVQHAPRLYLLLWGPHWTSDSTQAATASYLGSFYGGLGVEPQDNWSVTTTQYGDGSGFPTFSGSAFAGTWHDASAPPTGVTQTQLSAEADAFIAHNVPHFNYANDQVVVATQSGTCPAGFFAASCSGGNGKYCAWHSESTRGAAYTNLPYLLDSGSGCGENFVQNQYDGFSIVGGHEYAETITDPSVGSGWWDPNDSSGGEIGDKCAWVDLGTVTLSTGIFAIQPLWSNSASSCVRSTTLIDTVSVTSPGRQSPSLGATVSLHIHGGSNEAKPVTYSASGLPTGLSIGGTTGLISGKATWPGNYEVTVKATDATPATGSATFWWRVVPPHGAISLREHTSFCADDAGGSLASGTPVDLHACTGALAQNWAVFPNHSLRRFGGISAIDTGTCVNIVNRSTANGARLDLLSCDGLWNQLWVYSAATHEWRNPRSGKCLRGPHLTNGAPLELYACHASHVSEQWTNA